MQGVTNRDMAAAGPMERGDIRKRGERIRRKALEREKARMATASQTRESSVLATEADHDVDMPDIPAHVG